MAIADQEVSAELAGGVLLRGCFLVEHIIALGFGNQRLHVLHYIDLALHDEDDENFRVNVPRIPVLVNDWEMATIADSGTSVYLGVEWFIGQLPIPIAKYVVA